jgi:hypothetical protein
MENITAGPICGYAKKEDIPYIYKDLIENNFIPLFYTNKGELFEQSCRVNMPAGFTTIGIVVSIRYIYAYD